MSRKLFDNIMAIMSAIGAFAVVIDLIVVPIIRLFCLGIDTESRGFDAVRLGLGIVLFLTVVLFAVIFRKRHTDLYDLQYTMAKNNKLHPLRALVVITNDCEKGRDNKLDIDQAILTYELQRNGSAFHVKYGLDFQMYKHWNQKVTDELRRFRLYAISEDNRELKGVSAAINGIDRHIPLVCSRTLMGYSGDKMQRFAGLDKLQVVLPQHLNWRDSIKLKFEYLIEDQIGSEDAQYSFAIIPKNYGKSINKLTVELFTAGEKITNLHCYRIDVNGVLETVATFSEVDNTKEPYRVSFCPHMRSVYFVQFDLPRNIQSGGGCNDQIS